MPFHGFENAGLKSASEKLLLSQVENLQEKTCYTCCFLPILRPSKCVVSLYQKKSQFKKSCCVNTFNSYRANVDSLFFHESCEMQAYPEVTISSIKWIAKQIVVKEATCA